MEILGTALRLYFLWERSELIERKRLCWIGAQADFVQVLLEPYSATVVRGYVHASGRAKIVESIHQLAEESDKGCNRQ